LRVEGFRCLGVYVFRGLGVGIQGLGFRV
jgi:hypothetical protein